MEGFSLPMGLQPGLGPAFLLNSGSPGTPLLDSHHHQIVPCPWSEAPALSQRPFPSCPPLPSGGAAGCELSPSELGGPSAITPARPRAPVLRLALRFGSERRASLPGSRGIGPR